MLDLGIKNSPENNDNLENVDDLINIDDLDHNLKSEKQNCNIQL